MERFWKCETSQEEEGILRAFFRQKDIPQSLEPYRSLFVYEDEAKETKLGADFDEKILKLVEQPSVNARTYKDPKAAYDEISEAFHNMSEELLEQQRADSLSINGKEKKMQ